MGRSLCRIVAALLIVLAAPFFGFPDEAAPSRATEGPRDLVSLHLSPNGVIPLGHSAELYAFGGSAFLTGEYRLPILPVAFAKVLTGYAFAQTTNALTLSLVPIGVGGGLSVDPLPFLGLKLSAYGGGIRRDVSDDCGR